MKSRALIYIVIVIAIILILVLWNNTYYSIEKYVEITQSLEVNSIIHEIIAKEFSNSDYPTYRLFNPSILHSSTGDYHLSFRTSNNACKKYVDPLLTRSRAVLMTVGSITEESIRNGKYLLEDWNSAKASGVFHSDSGIEDVRLFEMNGKVYGIGNYLSNLGLGVKGNDVNDIANYRSRMILIDFDITKGLLQPKLFTRIHFTMERGSNSHQKNWAPIEADGSGKMLFVYSFDPLIIIQYDTITTLFKTGKGIPKTHGGTQVIKKWGSGNGYLTMVHTKKHSLTRGYAQFFVELSEDFEITKVHPKVCLGKSSKMPNIPRMCGIQFASGLCRGDKVGEYILSYSQNDCTAEFVTIEIP